MPLLVGLDNGNQALLLLAAIAARSSAGSTQVLCERSSYVVGVVDSWVCGSVSDSAPICAAICWQVAKGSALGTKVVRSVSVVCVCVWGRGTVCHSSVLLPTCLRGSEANGGLQRRGLDRVADGEVIHARLCRVAKVGIAQAGIATWSGEVLQVPACSVAVVSIV